MGRRSPKSNYYQTYVTLSGYWLARNDFSVPETACERFLLSVLPNTCDFAWSSLGYMQIMLPFMAQWTAFFRCNFCVLCLIYVWKYRFSVLKEPPDWGGSIKYPQSLFWEKKKKKKKYKKKKKKKENYMYTVIFANFTFLYMHWDLVLQFTNAVFIAKD